MGEEVKLCRYDLSQGMAAQFSVAMTGQYIEGIWHTSLVVFGMEYYFDGGLGVATATPRTTRFGQPSRVESLGTTQKTREEFAEWNRRMHATRFGPNDYSLIYRNCNSYTDEAAMFLTGHGIPEDIVHMIERLLSTPLGMMMRPSLEMMSMNPNVQPTPSQQPQQGAAARAPMPLADLDASISALQKQSDVRQALLFISSLEAILQHVSSHFADKKHCVTLPMALPSSNPLETALRGVGLRGTLAPGNKFEVECIDTESCTLPRLQHAVTNLATAHEALELDVALEESLEEVCPQKEENVPQQQQPAQSTAPPPQVHPQMQEKAAPVASQPPWHWMDFNLPVITNDAFKAGAETSGEPLYIVRCINSEQEPVSGKYGSHFGNSACIPHQGQEIQVRLGQSRLQLLCVDKQHSLCWLSNTLVHLRSDLPAFVVPIDKKRTAAVVRAKLGGGCHPGCWRERTGACIPYGGKSTRVTDFEVLCDASALPPQIAEENLRFMKQEKSLARLVALAAARCRPMGKLEDVLNFEASSVPIVARRSMLRAKALIEKKWREDRPKLLVCHDFRGGYVPSESSAVSLNDADLYHGAYTMNAWEHVDAFVYFSHNLFSIPPQNWCIAAHRHGAVILGTLMTEGASGQHFWQQLLNDASLVERLAEQMTVVAHAYSFDGWLLNVETPVPPSFVDRLIRFVGLLTNKLHAQTASVPYPMVVWYDAVTTQGTVQYQNALTQLNKPFFDACDGLFTNYWYDELRLGFSSSVAGSRKKDVFVGIDVYGRNTFGGGGLRCNVAFDAIHKNGMSVALFAPGWTHEGTGGKGNRPAFLAADAEFWNRITPYLGSPKATVITALPFESSFCSGVGRQYYVFGREGFTHASEAVRERTSWSCLGCQDPTARLPLERIGGDAPIVSFDESCAFLGDKSLRMSIPHCKRHSAVRLFQMDVEASGPIVCEIALRQAEAAHPLEVCALFTFRDPGAHGFILCPCGATAITELPQSPLLHAITHEKYVELTNGWRVYRFRLACVRKGWVMESIGLILGSLSSFFQRAGNEEGDSGTINIGSIRLAFSPETAVPNMVPQLFENSPLSVDAVHQGSSTHICAQFSTPPNCSVDDWLRAWKDVEKVSLSVSMPNAPDSLTFCGTYFPESVTSTGCVFVACCLPVVPPFRAHLTLALSLSAEPLFIERFYDVAV